LVREMGELDAAFIEGRPSPLAALPVQYADYARWQRESLTGEVLAAQLAYWRERLGFDPPVLDLPTDRPRPLAESYLGARRSLDLPAGIGDALSALGREHGSTLFMVVLAAFQSLLRWWTGQDDLTVGSPVAGRTRAEVEGLAGLFINTLALRADLSGDPSFAVLLAQVRETALGAYAHQDVPFEKLVEELSPERSLSHSPIFQVMLTYLNVPREEFAAEGLKMTPMGVASGTSKFDLTLSVRIDGERTILDLEHSTELFDPATIGRMSGHLVRLLESALAEPGRRVAELPLLGLGEERQLLEWNSTAAAYPVEPCLHELIEAQVERAPERVAVTSDGRTLTYRELGSAADRLALRLREAGVGAESVVGVLAERSLEMVVGLLAVLKAGGAYLPLDPEYPAERLAFMIADSRMPVLLAQERLLARLPEHGGRVLPLEDAAEPGEEVARPDAETGAGAGSLAYVIYTSGSTGRPKGTMNSHRGIVNRLLWMQERYGLGADDRVLQKTPYSFDVSAWELFWPLLTGARLVMARPGGHQEPDYLARTIPEEGITTMHFVPSLLRIFLETPGIERCAASLRLVVCSGEALPLELERRFFERLPGVELHNLYGPTEAAVDVTFWACQPDDPRGLVPIGRPVANTRIHVVDRELRPLPVGVPGELLIGGIQVGRGYLARPDLTAERFIPDPLSGEAGARLYRTGDLARLLADGAADFLGRIDHQVKLRGLRIELGEIEAALSRHPEVAQAVVVVREDTPGNALLTAYYVPTGEAAPGAADLRAALRAELPEYMVPAWFVPLSGLPLTSSGKVDRKALPAPEGGRAGGREFVPPQGPVQERLAAIWAEVLRVERVGAHDNFFELGGHSLLATQVLSRVREAFDVELPLRVIFDISTVAGIAEAVMQKELERADDELLARLLSELESEPAQGEI
ncbi:MAG: amino acid adenylation domain-containing protein, partial [Thermoanaerobaculia bacterium]